MESDRCGCVAEASGVAPTAWIRLRPMSRRASGALSRLPGSLALFFIRLLPRGRAPASPSAPRTEVAAVLQPSGAPSSAALASSGRGTSEQPLPFVGGDAWPAPRAEERPDTAGRAAGPARRNVLHSVDTVATARGKPEGLWPRCSSRFPTSLCHLPTETFHLAILDEWGFS